MEKTAALIKLNHLIIELENNEYFQEADELHELYIKLAAQKPWYRNPLIVAPALMGSMIYPGSKTVDRIQNRELYQATRGMQPFQLRDESNLILLWKKFLNTKIDPNQSFLPMNGVFDNITQIRTNEFAEKNNLPHTPNKLDAQLIESAYKTFPNDSILNKLIQRLRSTERSKHILPSQDPFSTDIYSQIEPESQKEYLEKHIHELPKEYKQILEQLRREDKPIRQSPNLRKIQPTKKSIPIKKEKVDYGVFESDKKGLPYDTPDEVVYRTFKRLRDKYEGRISLDKHDTGNKNPNKVPGGGGTKFGITQANWDGYCMRHKMELSPVTKITREQAEAVGFEDYKRSGAQILPPNTQLAVADYHFNSGPGNMVIALREILGLPPIQIQGLKRADLIQLIKGQKKLLYPMIIKQINTQEDDEEFAKKIYSARVKLLAGSKTRKKKKQLVHNRGLLNRINEMAEITGNETQLDEIAAEMKDLTPKQRLELLQKNNLDRARYYPPGYGNTGYDKKIREQFDNT